MRFMQDMSTVAQHAQKQIKFVPGPLMGVGD